MLGDVDFTREEGLLDFFDERADNFVVAFVPTGFNRNDLNFCIWMSRLNELLNCVSLAKGKSAATSPQANSCGISYSNVLHFQVGTI